VEEGMNADGMKQPAGSALAGLKVLVVEDEAIIAFDLEGTLRELGCVVLPIAPSVAEALAVLKAERPEAALLDVRLADGEVTPVAEALAVIGVPFALVTGCEDGALSEPLARTPLRIHKPYSPEDVRQTLSQLLQPPPLNCR
jgi:CheY-like chemotaxis protein